MGLQPLYLHESTAKTACSMIGNPSILCKKTIIHRAQTQFVKNWQKDADWLVELRSSLNPRWKYVFNEVEWNATNRIVPSSTSVSHSVNLAFTCRAKGRDYDEEDEPHSTRSYWDGEEGKKKLKEIEELRELVKEAKSLEEAMFMERDDAGGIKQEMTQEMVDKLREELARKAIEQVERRKKGEDLFVYGQRAYGVGVYDKAEQIFESALTYVNSGTNLGGEIQIWLAMAYDANGRHGDCVAMYKTLEGSHPNQNIRRQAADLRYIAEAPKLKITKEEMVSIPLLDKDNNSDNKTWSEMVRERRRKPAKKLPKGRDYMDDLMSWNPPRWEKSPYFWVALSVWLTAVGVSLVFQN